MAKDFKDTLNLPQTAFPMKANLTKREPEIIRFWQERSVYRKLQEKNKNGKTMILHDGPPYANGHIHMGHVLNKVLKDIIVKYWSMKGYYAPFVPGWDCHGLPIELQVDKKLGTKKNETPLLKKRQLCREYADKFVNIQRDEFIRLGIFGDWQRPYLTMDYEYEASIAEEFLNFLRKGYVYRGRKPVHWCPSCVTALAEAEVEYAEKVSPSIYVKFRLKNSFDKDRETYFIIWTTTPWTLPANLALAVNPEVLYSLIDTGDALYIVASALVEAVAEKTGLKGDVLRELRGIELEGLKAEHPFINRDSVVITGDFVSTIEGTGVVHIAPGHGEEDYLAGLKNGLEIYAPVDDYGRFTIEDYGLYGLNVFKANEKIIEVLQDKGALLNSSQITHSYPHCWRCKKPVIFRATEQWFISIEHDNLRHRCLKEIERVRWIPHWGKERIKGMMSNRPDWCISRQRAWGVPITVIICSNCGEIVQDESFFKEVIEKFRNKGADIWFELEPKDFLPQHYRCRCGSSEFKKETDILDVWFDSGVSHAAVLERDERLHWPSYMYLEGSDQHRGWFQSSLIASVGTRDRAPYDVVLTHGFVVDGEGKKMSKSLGNVISPEEIIKDHGAEILRLWVSAEDYRNDVRLSKEIINRLVEAYRKIRNTCRFLLGNLYDFDHGDYRPELLEIDRWAMHRLHSLIKRVSEAYERYDFHEVFHRIYNFCVVDLSAFYLDILKDRLYTFAPDSPERRASQWTIYQILNNLVRLMAPVLSFTAEEIWQHLPKPNKTESVFLTDFPVVDEQFIDKDLEKRWNYLIEIRNVVNRALEIKRTEKYIGNSLEAKVKIYASGEYLNLLNEYKDFLPSLFIVSQVEVYTDAEAPAGTTTDDEIPVSVIVERAEGQKCARCWNWSPTVGQYSDEPEVCSRCYRVLKVLNEN
jgi:isoleucyl-tRNA synthetase